MNDIYTRVDRAQVGLIKTNPRLARTLSTLAAEHPAGTAHFLDRGTWSLAYISDGNDPSKVIDIDKNVGDVFAEEWDRLSPHIRQNNAVHLAPLGLLRCWRQTQNGPNSLENALALYAITQAIEHYEHEHGQTRLVPEFRRQSHSEHTRIELRQHPSEEGREKGYDILTLATLTTQDRKNWTLEVAGELHRDLSMDQVLPTLFAVISPTCATLPDTPPAALGYLMNKHDVDLVACAIQAPVLKDRQVTIQQLVQYRDESQGRLLHQIQYEAHTPASFPHTDAAVSRPMSLQGPARPFIELIAQHTETGLLPGLLETGEEALVVQQRNGLSYLRVITG